MSSRSVGERRGGERAAPVVVRADGSRSGRSYTRLHQLGGGGRHRRLGLPPVLPDQRQPAAGAENAGDLRQRGLGGEPVERLADEDGVDRGVVERDRLGPPSRTRYASVARVSTARMPGSGSTAITRPKRSTSGRVSLPVPAPRSSTSESGPEPEPRDEEVDRLRRILGPDAVVVPAARRPKLKARAASPQARPVELRPNRQAIFAADQLPEPVLDCLELLGRKGAVLTRGEVERHEPLGVDRPGLRLDRLLVQVLEPCSVELRGPFPLPVLPPDRAGGPCGSATAFITSAAAGGSGGSGLDQEFQIRTRPPRRRSTRAISVSAAAVSNQWNAWPTKTASTDPSGSGIASALPSRTR